MCSITLRSFLSTETIEVPRGGRPQAFRADMICISLPAATWGLGIILKGGAAVPHRWLVKEVDEYGTI